MSSQVMDRITGLLVRGAFFFEPLAPRAISFYLSRVLNEWKQRGLISEYQTRTHRLGKFHYKIEVEVEVNPKQAEHFVHGELRKRLKILGGD